MYNGVMNDITPAHTQVSSHRYFMHYPPHPARKDDPHYVDFDHYHRNMRAKARCYIGERIGYEDCKNPEGETAQPEGDFQPGLELHHSHIEFSLQNGVSLTALEKDYPGVSDADNVGKWVESADNLIWLCAWHHRGSAGAHTAAYADWEASKYIQGLITKDQ